MAKTSILLRNNNTLAPVVTVYDLYDAKIYEQINDKYTFDFNILPYENVWQIGYPNIVEVNNDYFQIRRVTKYRTNTLAMSISCEHVSYELNAPYDIAMTNEEEWPDFVYEATPTAILSEMLGGTRFNVGSVMFTGSVKFVSSAMGMRSMIIEFAKHIGAEVKFEKFTVSLLARRGADNGLLLNVGKNILDMTQIIETSVRGTIEKSYELGVVDLNKIVDSNGNPMDTKAVRLGDGLNLVDADFEINIYQHINSVEFDPFSKALPTIGVDQSTKDITKTINDIDSKPEAEVNLYQENTTRTKYSNSFGYETKAPGNHSHAEGYRTTSSGDYSHAEGYDSIASGNYSHAEGVSTKAEEYASHAEGANTIASGDYSHAECRTTIASGAASHAEGEGSVASGFASHAEGFRTEASNIYSHSEGYQSKAQGAQSHAEGYLSVASGYTSHAEGYETIANQSYSHAGGSYNKEMAQNDIFAIGNGNWSARSNAFRVTNTGAVYGQSAFNSAGADYAEFFEWQDGNPNAEERKGYFVTLDGDKIRIATSADIYILGVVSVNPSVIGDSYQDQWANMYLTNEWGEVQKETVTIPATFDKKGTEIIPEHEEIRSILNPNYDGDTEYIPREQRKEWSPIGMMGKLLVRDDGTTLVNGYCKPNDNGIATTYTDGYRVMERVSENIIRVLVK